MLPSDETSGFLRTVHHVRAQAGEQTSVRTAPSGKRDFMLETQNVPQLRPGAAARPDMIHSVVCGSPPPASLLWPLNGDGASQDPRPVLGVVAWVNNVAYAKEVWVDAFLLGASGEVVASESLPLVYRGIASQDGDFFGLNARFPRDPTADLPEDLSAFAYRLYYRVNSALFTEGILHRQELAPAR